MIGKAILAHFISLLLFTFVYSSLPHGTFEFSDQNRTPTLLDFLI